MLRVKLKPVNLYEHTTLSTTATVAWGRRLCCLRKMVRPERFELPTTKFVAWYSIQLSYGRTLETLDPVTIAVKR